MQPVVSAYVIIDVPTETPVITPPDDIVATPGVELVHVPPVGVTVHVTVVPVHTLPDPTSELGAGFTDTGMVV